MYRDRILKQFGQVRKGLSVKMTISGVSKLFSVDYLPIVDL